jgi:ppGpp synthetase/RelA/SpoT-type nucleotidyltranferase
MLRRSQNQAGLMGLIDDFIARYVKEYDYYDQASRLAKDALETNLNAAGVRCIVTSRAKSLSRLEEKCRKRDKDRETPYETFEEVATDIVDLAGVRVALYFPAEREQVDKLVTKLFNLLTPSIEFPKSQSFHRMNTNALPGTRQFTTGSK